jgi:hypothetical protein
MAREPNPRLRTIDLRRGHEDLYRPSAKHVSEVDVPELKLIAVEGRIEAGEGPSDSRMFADHTATLYQVSYTLKFMSKQDPDNPIDYKVMPLEGLWATESGVFEWGKREPWLYRLFMVQPDHVTPQMLEQALAKATAKSTGSGPGSPVMETWEEGPSIQIMHLGPYSEEPRSLDLMQSYADEKGLEMHGRHHEIYLGDPRRTKPEKMKTVLRHPVREAS